MSVGLEEAERQLDRVLGFFARLDAKASALFAIDAAMLGVLSAKISSHTFQHWLLGFSVLATVLLLGTSLAFLYVSGFPHTKGGKGSLIYFNEIASRTEANFISETRSTNREIIFDDVLGQIWRNSEILQIKFQSLKRAFVTTAIALVPWCIYLASDAVIVSQ